MANTTDEHKLVVALEARVRNFERAMDRGQRKANQTVKRIEQRFGYLQRSLDRTFGRIARGIAAGLSAAAINQAAQAVRNVVREVDGIGKAADRIGLSTTALQQLRFGADLAGVSVSTLEMAMQRFSRRIGEAADGTGVLKDVLEANGIAIRDNEGDMRSVEAILDDYADLMQRAASEQERLALAVRAFDSEGAALVNLLRDGSQGLADMRREATDLGVVIEEDLVRSAEEINDKFTVLTTQIGTRFKSAVLEAVTAINTLADTTDDALDRLNRWFESTRSAEDRMRGALGNYEFQTRQGLSTQSQNFFDRSTFNMPNGQATAPAIVPPEQDTETRAARTAAIREQTDATRALIQELQHELSLVGLSAQEQEIANAQRRAGSDATDAQRAQIAQLISQRHAETAAIDAQRQAQDELTGAMEYFGQEAVNGLMSVVSGADDAEDAMKRLAVSIADAVAQAALFGSGPLASVFGGGGVLNGIFGGVGKPMLLAEGGKISGPGTGTSDSIPAMLSDGEYVVNAQAVRKPGVRGLLDRINAMDSRIQGFAKGGIAERFALAPTGHDGGRGMMLGGFIQ